MTIKEFFADYAKTREELDRMWHRIDLELILVGICGWPVWAARIYAEVDE